jgi:beta-1,4-mannosyl-glycoprotein beta-1,4-N-acetylglucosaminyltransferase
MRGPRTHVSRFPGAQKLRMCKLYASKKMRGSLLNKIHTRLWNAVHWGVGSRICRIENAGWHLTSIGGWESWRLKVDSFSHAEYRHDPIYASQEAFTRHVRETTSRVDLDELPAYVRENVDKFAIFGS